MTSEGRVHVCKWVEKEGRLHLRLRGRPRVKADYANWDDVHDQFWEVVMLATGDCEPVLTFDPPLPTSSQEAELLSMDLALISGAAYSGSKTSPAELFTEGLCRTCGYARGERNDNAAHFYACDADICQAPQEWWFTASGLYVSERFLSLLTSAEIKCFDTRPITRPPRSRRKYFEIAPRSFIPYVAHANRLCNGGWRCTECGRQTIAQRAEDNSVGCFIAQDDLPSCLPPILAVGDPAVYELCLPCSRARQLMARPEAKGLSVQRVGVLPPSLTDRRPQLPSNGRRLTRWLPRDEDD